MENTYTEPMEQRTLADGRPVVVLGASRVENGIDYVDVLLDGHVTTIRAEKLARVARPKQIGGKRWQPGKWTTRGVDYAARAGMVQDEEAAA